MKLYAVIFFMGSLCGMQKDQAHDTSHHKILRPGVEIFEDHLKELDKDIEDQLRKIHKKRSKKYKNKKNSK